MNSKFDPKNPVVQLCMAGMNMEEIGEVDEAIALFQRAWHEAADDYERFIAAYHLALRQGSAQDKLRWMKTSLECALNIDDDNVRSAYSTLYSNIAQCYEELGDRSSAEKTTPCPTAIRLRPPIKDHSITGQRQICRLGTY